MQHRDVAHRRAEGAAGCATGAGGPGRGHEGWKALWLERPAVANKEVKPPRSTFVILLDLGLDNGDEHESDKLGSGMGNRREVRNNGSLLCHGTMGMGVMDSATHKNECYERFGCF